MGETLLAGCGERLGVPVTSDVEETTGVAIPDLLVRRWESTRSYGLGRGALASLVEEVADDQEDDRPDHDSPSRAALSHHADERPDDDHDAS